MGKFNLQVSFTSFYNWNIYWLLALLMFVLEKGIHLSLIESIPDSFVKNFTFCDIFNDADSSSTSLGVIKLDFKIKGFIFWKQVLGYNFFSSQAKHAMGLFIKLDRVLVSFELFEFSL